MYKAEERNILVLINTVNHIKKFESTYKKKQPVCIIFPLMLKLVNPYNTEQGKLHLQTCTRA